MQYNINKNGHQLSAISERQENMVSTHHTSTESQGH
jgi:hypothetical protein